ncbi:MAG: Ig-like domain-containing protein [Gemmatimonadaceae bacterium]|nr:Ig-like domain-containing protein [Gemmatimonadaceae bacterium]
MTGVFSRRAGWMRRGVVALVAACTATAWACASSGAPPGGPPDTAPPKLLLVTPKSMTIGAKEKEIELRFDEVINETPKGVQTLEQLVFISPRVEDAQVSWHRTRLTIKPKGGWKPNTVYSVQISSGIQDLRNNAIDTAVSVVFSTGGAIPTTTISGVAFDWVGGRAANKALVEAIAKDSTTYLVLSDSIGRFTLRHVPMGEYLVRAIGDRNNNRDLDPTEAFDTIRVAVTQNAEADLYMFPHDTVGLRITSIEAPAADSLRVLRVVFDKPLAPGQTFTNPQFLLRRADSTAIGVALVQTIPQRAALDSAKKKARDDSVAALTPRDTSALARARADSAAQRKRADSVAAVERAAREARRLAALRGGRPAATIDTTPAPKMTRPVVYAELFLTLEERLEPGKPYSLRAATVRSLSGTVKSPSRAFVTPRPQKTDSTAPQTPTRRPP